jgi:hypothetical protein
MFYNNSIHIQHITAIMKSNIMLIRTSCITNLHQRQMLIITNTAICTCIRQEFTSQSNITSKVNMEGRFCFRCKMQYKVHIEQNISGVIFFLFLSKLTQYTLIVSVEYITLKIQNNKHFILMQL